MSDDADIAEIEIERGMAAAISVIRATPPVAVPTGFCLECDASVPSGHRWCDVECRDMWCARHDA